MKRSFTSFIAIFSLVAISGNSFSQCFTGGSFTVTSNNTFDTNTEGFYGDFGWSANGSGQLESTIVDLGSIKVLTSSTFFMPATETTLAWSYNLSGTANVVSYIVSARYSDAGIVRTVNVCSGGSLPTTGTSLPLIFAAVAPSEIIGKSFQLQISFTSSSNGAKILVIDNFKTNSSNSSSILPVNINYFNAVAEAGKVKLTWLVADENNVNRYEIERSTNGKKWAKIGQVNASGLVTYTFLDATYVNGSNYYRLKAVDNNGTFKYSSVVLFKVGKSGIALRAYPSPATDEVIIKHDAATNMSMIDVLSVDGKLVKSVKPSVGNVETEINLSLLKKGLYFIRYVDSEGETKTLKLIKQ